MLTWVACYGKFDDVLPPRISTNPSISTGVTRSGTSGDIHPFVSVR